MKKTKFYVWALAAAMAVAGFSGCTDEESERNFGTDGTTYFIEEGYEGFHIVSNNKDMTALLGTDKEGLYTIQGGKLDSNKEKWIQAESFVVKIDPQVKRISLMTEDVLCNFYDYANGTCDIACIEGDNSPKVLEGVRIPDYGADAAGTMTKADEGAIGDIVKTIAATKASLELAVSLASNPKSIQSAIAGLEYIGSALSGTANLVISNSTSGLNLALFGKTPDLFSLLTTLVESGRTLSDVLTERFIGDWDVEILSAEQISKNLAQVTYLISGIKDNPSFPLRGNLGYVNTTESNVWTNKSIAAKNGVYTETFPLQSHGEYRVAIDLGGEWGFFTRDETRFETHGNPVYTAPDGRRIESKEYTAPNGKTYYIVDPSDWEDKAYLWEEALALETKDWVLIKTFGRTDKCSDRNTSAITFEELLGFPKSDERAFIDSGDWGDLGLHGYYVPFPDEFGEIFWSDRWHDCWSGTLYESSYYGSEYYNKPYRLTVHKNHETSYEGYLGQWNGQEEVACVRLVYNVQ